MPTPANVYSLSHPTHPLLIHFVTRRRCPGSHLIESSLWIVIACVLATLDVHTERDAQGAPIEPVLVFENAVFRSVVPRLIVRPLRSSSVVLTRENG